MITDMALGNRWTNIDWQTGAVITDKAALTAANAKPLYGLLITNSYSIMGGRRRFILENE